MTAVTFALEHQCPQCGAPVSLEETDRLFTCPYCRVRHMLHTSGYFRYVLPPLKTLVQDVFYVPYWRCKGLKFTVQESITKREIIDRSVCALTDGVKAPSLGVRSQTLRMKIIGPATSGIFLQPTMNMQDFMKILEAGPIISSLFPEGCCVFIGEAVSLIFAPYFLKESILFDGITGSMIGPAKASGVDGFPEKATARSVIRDTSNEPVKNLLFIPALCPACGMDLVGERESCLMTCTHCRCVYNPNENGLVGEDFFIAWPRDKADLWVPFWVMSVGCANAPLSSVADFYRLAGIPRPILPADEQYPFNFWVPAFKSNPELFLRLGKSFTIQQAPLEKPAASLSAVFPVTLPVPEAFQSIPVFLAEMAPARKKIFPLLRNLKLSLIKSTLVYIPLADRGAEYVQAHSNMAISKNALRVGKGV